VQVNAEAVVVCAGAIHTPALLLKSGLKHPQLGHNLHLHPVTAPVGIFDELVRSWQGPPQTRVMTDLSDMDGQGYGVRIEVAPAHPGLWASALPWTSGQGHKQLMTQVARMANVIVLTRDLGGGQITVNGQGWPVLDYQLAEHDLHHLKRGLKAGLAILKAAGAHTILSPHTQPSIFHQGEDQDFEQYLEQVAARSVGPNQWSLFSAHQMGSCRIAGSRDLGVVRPDGRVWGVGSLFVADASVFPTASGVNPMVTIMATAHFLSQRIKGQLA
jgi:choline dehydrogenase-like flavoprotein